MINKRQKKIIGKLIKASFSSKHEIKEKFVDKAIKQLKKMPFSEAISCLILYQKGLKREISKTTLEILSPTSITNNQKNKIIKIAAKNFIINKTNNAIDPSLFAGLRIKIGDQVFDSSIQNKIEQMKRYING